MLWKFLCSKSYRYIFPLNGLLALEVIVASVGLNQGQAECISMVENFKLFFCSFIFLCLIHLLGMWMLPCDFVFWKWRDSATGGGGWRACMFKWCTIGGFWWQEWQLLCSQCCCLCGILNSCASHCLSCILLGEFSIPFSTDFSSSHSSLNCSSEIQNESHSSQHLCFQKEHPSSDQLDSLLSILWVQKPPPATSLSVFSYSFLFQIAS